ncbi:aldo/keto reductase [Sulfitobacter sp. S190]|nr:aldo/keto reductase [Sulfitobacter sp. S190]
MTHTTFTFPNGRTINRIGYGAMRLTGQPRNFGPYADWQGGIDLLRRARELGVTHIDTARAYGPHDNERLIADALVDADGNYGEMFIASKGGVEKSAKHRPRYLGGHVETPRRRKPRQSAHRQDRPLLCACPRRGHANRAKRRRTRGYASGGEDRHDRFVQCHNRSGQGSIAYRAHRSGPEPVFTSR